MWCERLRVPDSTILRGYRSAKSLYAAARTLTGLTPAGIRGLSESDLYGLLQDALRVPEWRTASGDPLEGQRRMSAGAEHLRR